MSFLFSTRSNATLNHLWLFVYRITLSVFMMTHGLPKLNRLLSGNIDGFPDPFGIGSTMSLVLAVFGEVIAPVMVLLGLSTRLATIPVMVAMATAAFLIHANDPFRQQELALLFLAGFMTILIMGGGKYSLDNLLGRR